MHLIEFGKVGLRVIENTKAKKLSHKILENVTETFFSDEVFVGCCFKNCFTETTHTP